METKQPAEGATMREAIEHLLTEIISEAYAGGAVNYTTGTCPPPSAEVAYARLAALCEFPEEKVRNVCRKYRQARDEWASQVPYKRGSIGYTFDQMIADLKRLMSFDRPTEGVCLKCGGNKGRRHFTAPGGSRTAFFDCPQCDGTGGERRKETPQVMADTNLVYIGYSKQFNCPLYTEDRRSGED